MPFFDDFAAALGSYPSDYCTLAFTNVAVEDPPNSGNAMNTGETWRLKVKVENNGALSMNNVELHVLGKNGTTISTTGPAGPFVDGFQTFGSLTVNAGGSQKTDFLYFKAPPDAQPAGTDLIDVHFNEWNADLVPLLADSAGHRVGGSASVTFEREVFPA